MGVQPDQVEGEAGGDHRNDHCGDHNIDHRNNGTLNLSLRVVYFQATAEGPESTADHWQLESPRPLSCYRTTSW